MKQIILSLFLSLCFLFSSGQSTADMLEEALGAVVTVGVYKTGIAKRSLGFRGESAPEMAYEKVLDMAEVSGSGSGFIVRKNTKHYVITNAHVVENASDESGSIYIYTVNRNKYEVKLVGGDSFYDIAVLEFIDTPGNEISSVQFRENDIRVGEKVYAIGNPLGEYPYSVTDGIISAKNRTRDGMTGKFGFLQTTATIIWGNSGGPLIDENGKVAGINSQIAFADTPDGEQVLQSQINFALESGISKKLVDDIITNDGRVRRAYIGIEVSQKSGYEGYWDYEEVKLDELPTISGIIPGSPASKTLSNKVNWMIKEINGTQIRNMEEALGELEKTKPGSVLRLTLEKNGYEEKVSITTQELEASELENMAKFILDQNRDIIIDYNHPQVSFRMREEENFYYQNEKELYKQKMSKQGLKNSYFILAAGISSNDYESMWLTENIQDFGMAFKLSGMAGLIDFYVIKAGSNNIDDIELFRQYLSGDEDVTQSTIWY